MCEYCGCQSLTPIAELTREHETVVNLIGAVRAADARHDIAGMATVVRQIATVLGPHTQVEEQGLFPALVAEFPEHVATLREQHRRVETVLAEAKSEVPTDPTWPERLIEVLHLLREHILAEQDGVFPAALASLTNDQWEAVAAVRTRVGMALPDLAAREAR